MNHEVYNEMHTARFGDRDVFKLMGRTVAQSFGLALVAAAVFMGLAVMTGCATMEKVDTKISSFYRTQSSCENVGYVWSAELGVCHVKGVEPQ